MGSGSTGDRARSQFKSPSVTELESTGATRHVDAECGPSRDCPDAAKAQFAETHSRRRRLADHRQHTPGARRSQGRGRAHRRPDTGWSIAPSIFGETSLVAAGTRGQRARLFDQGKLFSSTHGWGRILGLLFPRGLMLLDFDEHRLHRRALSVAFKSGPMKSYLAALDAGIAARVAQWRAQPGTDAVLSGDETAHARPCRDLVPRRRHRAETDEITRAFIDMVAASVSRDPQAVARHQDGAWRQGPRAHCRLLRGTDFDSAATGVATTCSPSCARPPTRTARCSRHRISSTT